MADDREKAANYAAESLAGADTHEEIAEKLKSIPEKRLEIKLTTEAIEAFMSLRTSTAASATVV